MQKFMKKFTKSKSVKFTLSLFAIVFLVMLVATPVFAADTAADTAWTGIIKFLAKWIGRLGLAIAFIGAVQFGFGIKNDDADGKTKGLRAVMSGIVVYAVTLSLDLFGIV